MPPIDNPDKRDKKAQDYAEAIPDESGSEGYEPTYRDGSAKNDCWDDNRQEAVVLNMKKKYDASIDKLEKLVSKKKELESKEIMELLKTTTRSFEEIKAFLRGEDRPKDEA